MEFQVSDFWNRTKKLCKKNGITQSDLCKFINCPVQNLRNKITRGAYPNTIDTVKIAQCLGTSVEYLVTGKECEEQHLDRDNKLQIKLDKIAEIISS